MEYTFSGREGEYTVRRNPEYMRAGKRKNADGTVRLVKETAKELYVSLKENEADIRREIERVDAFHDPDLRWQEIAGMEMPPAEETQNTLKEIIRAGKSCLSELAKEEKQLQEQAEALRTQKDLNRVAEEISSLETWQKEHSEDERQLGEKLKELEEAFGRDEPGLQERIAGLREMLPRYETVRRMSAACAEWTEKMAECMEACRRAAAEYEDRYERFFVGQPEGGRCAGAGAAPGMCGREPSESRTA